MMPPLLLLALIAAYLATLLWRGRLVVPIPRAIRQRHLRGAVGLWLGYGLPGVVGLALIGRLGDVLRLPPDLHSAGRIIGMPPGSVPASLIALGLAAGSMVGVALTWWRARRGRAPLVVGKVAGLMPRSDADLVPAAVLAVSAGVTEELFFRLLLPLLVALATGSALAGCAVGCAAFAAMHRYQGWAGIAATFVGGLVLTVLYLGSGCLWLAMAAHAVADINALVLRPALGARWYRGRA